MLTTLYLLFYFDSFVNVDSFVEFVGFFDNVSFLLNTHNVCKVRIDALVQQT